MNPARRIALPLVISLGAAAPALGQTTMAWFVGAATHLLDRRDDRSSGARFAPRSHSWPVGVGFDGRGLPHLPMTIVDPRSFSGFHERNGIITFETPSARSSPLDGSHRFGIRIYEGDSRGVTDTERDGVFGYSVLLTDDPPAPAPKPPDKPPPPPPPPAAQPTLDELLGITPAPSPEKPTTGKPADGPPSPADPSKADLNRRLTGQELSDAFKQAVALMGDASTRLTDQKDPGLDTQRIQEDAVKRLDQLISSLQKQQSQQQQQPQQGQSDPKQGPPQQGKQGKAQQSPEQKGGDGERKDLGPSLQEGALNPQLESARAAWGSLPARIRDMLMQGTEDRFSARYKALTQEYYKRLAEENSK